MLHVRFRVADPAERRTSLEKLFEARPAVLYAAK